MEMRVKNLKSKFESKKDLKTIALGTSKTNYIDPRIVVAWCKKEDFPIEKMFTNTLLDKFCWAMSTPTDWKF